MNSQNNDDINKIESGERKGDGLEVRTIAIKINAAIRRYEARRLNQVDLPELYDVFEELSILTGIAESTLRGYTNRYTPKFPTIDKFLLLCKVLEDDTPLKALSIIGEHLINKAA